MIHPEFCSNEQQRKLEGLGYDLTIYNTVLDIVVDGWRITYQSAFRFLWEKYELWVLIVPQCPADEIYFDYSIKQFSLSGASVTVPNRGYYTDFDLCRSECLDRCLQIAKEMKEKQS